MVMRCNPAPEYHQKPFAFALRPMIKLPTGSDDPEKASSTRKVDFLLDAVLRKEITQRVEVSGYAGFITRGAPDLVEETNGFRWGLGAGFPSRKGLRLTARALGEEDSD